MSRLTEKDEFSVKLIGAITDVLKNEDNEFHISMDDLVDDATDFFHALMNIMPTVIHNSITDEEINILQANHIANTLIYQKKRVNNL